MLQIVKTCIRWFKRNRKSDLRDKCVEKYGEEFGKIYDDMAKGIPVAGFTTTAHYLMLIEEARKEIENEQQEKRRINYGKTQEIQSR